jgi:hypothetical protein
MRSMKPVFIIGSMVLFLAGGAWSQTRSTLPGTRAGRRPEVVQDTTVKDTVKPASSLADWATTWLRFGSHTDTAYAKIASLQIGFNFYFKNPSLFAGDTVKNMGLAIALGVPVRIPYLVSWANIKLLVHGMNFVHLKNPGEYLSIINELNLGKNFVLLGQPIEYIPHVGFGIDNGIAAGAVSDANSAPKFYQVHYYMHLNFGLIARKQIELYGIAANVGLAVNYEVAFVNNKGEDTKQRFNVSLIGAY